MQKHLFYRYFTLFMAVLVLTSSIGVGLVEKECSTRGKSVALAYSEKEDGCKLCRSPKKQTELQNQHQAPVFKKQHCCLEKQQLKNIEIQVVSGKKSEKTTDDFSVAIPAHHPGFNFFEATSTDIGGHAPAGEISFSSRFYGRTMLSFVQVYLI